MGFLVCLCRKMGGKCIHKHGVCTHVCVSRDAHALSRAPGGVARSAHLCPRAAGAGGPNVSAKLVSQQGMTWYKMHVFLLSLGWGGRAPAVAKPLADSQLAGKSPCSGTSSFLPQWDRRPHPRASCWSAALLLASAGNPAFPKGSVTEAVPKCLDVRVCVHRA